MSKHIGSSLDDFLEEEGILESSEAIAAKRVFVYQLQKELDKNNLSRSDLAQIMGTSRSSIKRLLDPNQPSNLKSLIQAAKAVGKKLKGEHCLTKKSP